MDEQDRLAFPLVDEGDIDPVGGEDVRAAWPRTLTACALRINPSNRAAVGRDERGSGTVE